MRVTVTLGVACCAVAVILAGCVEGARRAQGGSCSVESPCADGVCHDGRCLAADGDEDNDGLSNAQELELGLNPISRDSDGDGADDLAEVGGDPADPRDEDGDGIIDALESSGADSDGDCVNDQRDPDALGPPDGTIEATCPGVGLCADEAAALRVTCRLDELGSPTFSCDYSGISGHAAADERCDGVDEDCDGATDEDYVTNATFCDEGACSATGVRTCVEGAEVDSCDRPVTEDDTTCDGVDDDCDGATDDDFVPTDTSCGLGPCTAAGQLLCVDGDPVDSCAPLPAAASDETCDGVDDDCDGEADEDYEARATSCGVGACARGGTTSCALGVESDDCEPGEAAADDATCDDVDDDCDGEVDEDFVAVETTCGVGPCAGSGMLACVDGQAKDSCESGVGAAQDADCDGVDDDCDGDPDEDYEPRVTSCGTGACASAGVTSCAGGEERDSCQPGAPLTASDVTCDGVDDDCDGETDESYVPASVSCGVGACADNGVTRCAGGEEAEICTPKSPLSESDVTCDRLDDDCDGEIDEDFVASGTTCGRGACTATGTRVCSIQGTVVDSCTPGAPLSATDTTCDDVDDDCSGVADEDFAVTTTTCGTGACSTEGQRTCQGGEIVDTCVAGTEAPSDADCDGVDDDCNGATDEDYVPVTVSCGTGACVASGTRVCSGGVEEDVCTPLAPSCTGRECGPDGCGGSCGTCTAPVGSACVAATCNAQQQCELDVLSGCFIGGVCHASGAPNPSNPCQVCNVANPLGWSLAAAGSSCTDDGDPCTADRCDSVGTCQHVAKTDFAGCDDGSAATHGDVCIESVCTGFIEVLEPRFGTGAESFVSGGQGAHVWGAGGLTPVAGALWVTRYGAAEQAVSQSLGTAEAHFALDARYVANGNVLWELVDGAWSSTRTAGTIRDAFPGDPEEDVGAAYYRLRLGTPSISNFVLLTALGMSANGPALHRMCTSPAGSDGEPTTWTCAALGSASNDYAAGLGFVGGIIHIGSNVGSREAPTQIRVRSYDPDQDSWTTLAPLSITTPSGRRLLDFTELAASAPFQPTTMAIGVGTGGLFFVTDLTTRYDISFTGVAPIDWLRAVSFQGRAVVLGHRADSTGVSTVLASAPLDRVTSPSDWTLTTVLPSGQGRRADTLSADPEHLYLLGARSVSGALEQSAVWRLRPAPDPEEIWEETFSNGVVPAGWTVHAFCGSEGSASWSVADGVLQLFGNCIDAPASTQDIRRIGTFITTGDQFGQGTLQVAFFAFDNDAFGVVYDVQDTDNYFRVSLDAQSGHARLVKVVGGVYTLLAEEAPYAPELKAWQRLEVRRSGATHQIRVDGRVLFNVTDGTWSGGTFGLYGWAMNDVRFEDLRIFPL